jgi:uncharacterized membrane protein YeaQ/YmgE (transglycosylase-associated protein family)
MISLIKLSPNPTQRAGHVEPWIGQRAERLPPQPIERSAPEKETNVEVIGVIIAGIIIGLLGKWIAPGDRDNIPLWLTLLCGIGGVLIGYYLAAAFGVEETDGIDWIRWLISIAVAVVLVMIAATVTGRRGHKVT